MAKETTKNEEVKITEKTSIRIGKPVRFVDIAKRGSGRHNGSAPVFQKEGEASKI